MHVPLMAPVVVKVETNCTNKMITKTHCLRQQPFSSFSYRGMGAGIFIVTLDFMFVASNY